MWHWALQSASKAHERNLAFCCYAAEWLERSKVLLQIDCFYSCNISTQSILPNMNLKKTYKWWYNLDFPKGNLLDHSWFGVVISLLIWWEGNKSKKLVLSRYLLFCTLEYSMCYARIGLTQITERRQPFNLGAKRPNFFSGSSDNGENKQSVGRKSKLQGTKDWAFSNMGIQQYRW